MLNKSIRLLIISFSILVLVCFAKTKPVYADAALAPGSLILTPQGNIPIEKLTSGDRIFGYNFANHEIEINTIDKIQKISSLSHYLINNQTAITGTSFVYLRSPDKTKIIRIYELKPQDKLIGLNHSNFLVQQERQVVKPSEFYEVTLDNNQGNFYVDDFLVYDGATIPTIFKENYTYCDVGTSYFHECNNLNSKSWPGFLLALIILFSGIIISIYLMNILFS